MGIVKRALIIIAVTFLAIAGSASASTTAQQIEAQQVASFSTAARSLGSWTRLTASGTIYCYGKQKTIRAKNAIGKTMWWYRQRLVWCGTLGPDYYWIVTSVNKRCTKTTYGITLYGAWWEFVGHTDCYYSGGIGKGQVMRGRQGHFRYCTPWTGCISNLFPWAKVWGSASGSWWTAGGTG